MKIETIDVNNILEIQAIKKILKDKQELLLILDTLIKIANKGVDAIDP